MSRPILSSPTTSPATSYLLSRLRSRPHHHRSSVLLTEDDSNDSKMLQQFQLDSYPVSLARVRRSEWSTYSQATDARLMAVSANATATLLSNNGILTSKFFDTLSYPIYSINAKPTRPRRPLRRLRLMTGPCKVHNSPLTYPCPHAPQHPTRSSSRLLHLVHQARTALTAYPLSSSCPRLELPQFRPDFGLGLTRSPARNGGAQGLE